MPLVQRGRPAAVRARVRAGFAARLIVCGLAIFAAAFASVLVPMTAYADGPDAVMTPTGYNANSVARGDDTSNLVVNLPFAMNWNGTAFTQIYINMNGNVTFGAGYTGYNPNTTLAATNRNIMAPFWADVDTRNTGAAQVTYSTTVAGNVPQVGGRNAFFVNWVDVARYNNQSTPTNAFQLVLVDRSDTGAGNFDFIFNYDRITWDIATAASTVKARAGWGFSGTGFELPGSGVASGATSTLLDSSAASTSLIQNSLNSGGQLGRYVFQVRNGQPPNIPPQIAVTNRTLEGNATNSYTGYTGVGDASATDPDGSIVSFTNNLPEVLPLGTTQVTWTAEDNRGAVTSVVQTIVVVDTTPPANPTLTSPTHSTGTWTNANVVTVNSAGATDICTGVNGFSYGWSSGVPATPDSTLDPAIEQQVTVEVPVVVHEETWPDAAWPADWIPSDATYVRLTNAAGRTQGSYAAEVWANNNTRRTVNFYRDYDLSGLTSATLSFWDRLVGSNGTDYVRAEYSTNGGTSYTQLRNATTNATWGQRSFSLPVGGTVRVRFSASVNNAAEYANWDDIIVSGTTMSTTTVLSTSTTTALADGTWFFNLRTVDNAGNWSAPVNLGPFLLDTTAPVTSSNVPSAWSPTPVTVTLTASDAGQVTLTRYSLDGITWQNYSGPFTISTEGATTLRFFSIDAAGHVEAVKTATVRIDTIPPSAPVISDARATSTSSVEITWSASTDTGSGLDYYRVYRDGSVVATTTSTSYVNTGLTPGQTYTFRISAVDRAGNESVLSSEVPESLPTAEFWLSVSNAVVDMGSVDVETGRTLASATTVTVGGIGPLRYDFGCSASDFANQDLSSSTPFMPIGLLRFATAGWVTRPLTAFSTGQLAIESAVGSPYSWSHAYLFDFDLSVPFDYDPGVYVSHITYTAVLD